MEDPIHPENVTPPMTQAPWTKISTYWTYYSYSVFKKRFIPARRSSWPWWINRGQGGVYV